MCWAAARGGPSFFDSVVGSFLGNGDVVDVAFAEAGVADANEARLLLYLGDAGAADIPHAALETADELVDHHGNGTAIGNAAFDTFRNKLRETVSGAVAVAAHARVFG